LLWRLWSPTWAFTDTQFAATAAAFENPDFVDVVVHSYRHRYELVPGDDRYAAFEARHAKGPPIAVPTLRVHAGADAAAAADAAAQWARFFTGRYERRLLEGIGHNVPQEAPSAFARAVLDVSS